MTKPVIGLALGSGAARGWSHIGIIEVLEEEGIRADVVTGCSIGAFVGAALVTGRMQQLHEWAIALDWRNIAGMIDIAFKGGGLIEGRHIERLMETLEITGNIEDIETAFATVATDFVTGREEWHRSGPIGKTVRASISLPGIFAPVNIGGEWFVDGGLVNPVPISTCRALGANLIIAVNLNGDLLGRRSVPLHEDNRNNTFRDVLAAAASAIPKSHRSAVINAVDDFLKPKQATPGYFDVLANSINIMQDRITRSRIAGEPPHVLLTPRLADMGIFDFDKAEMAIEEGRRCARYALPEIERLLNGHRA